MKLTETQLLGYALPCAAVLTTTLQNVSRSNGSLKLPTGVSRSTLIRNLSMFVSHLQSICSPGDGDYKICVQASKAMSRVLDEVLEGPGASNAEPQTPISASNEAVVDVQAVLNSSIQPLLNGAETADIGDLDMLGGEGLDEFDLSTWIKNIDWTVTGGEWSAF